LAEFGLVEAQGLHKMARLIAIVTDEMDARVPDIARQVLKVIIGQIEEIQTTDRWARDAGPRVTQEQPSQPTSGYHPGDRATHRRVAG
jgi:agmatine/peptidylarginine deiminase